MDLGSRVRPSCVFTPTEELSALFLYALARLYGVTQNTTLDFSDPHSDSMTMKQVHVH